jgi:arginase
MPAADYRMPDGIHFEELSVIINTLLSSGKSAGMSVSIYNPLLDPSRKIARELVESMAAGFNSARAR